MASERKPGSDQVGKQADGKPHTDSRDNFTDSGSDGGSKQTTSGPGTSGSVPKPKPGAPGGYQ